MMNLNLASQLEVGLTKNSISIKGPKTTTKSRTDAYMNLPNGVCCHLDVCSVLDYEYEFVPSVTEAVCSQDGS